MKHLSLVAGITALVSLLTVIIVTPAMAQEGLKSPDLTPVHNLPERAVRAPSLRTTAIVFSVDRLVVKPCTVRQLDQGSGSVRICG